VQRISHPMRLDSVGSVVSLDDASTRAAAELGAHVLACLQGERSLSPVYGLRDPAQDGISADVVAGAIAICEPELEVLSIRLSQPASGLVRVEAEVKWSES
jgi:hypothetical protein